MKTLLKFGLCWLALSLVWGTFVTPAIRNTTKQLQPQSHRCPDTGCGDQRIRAGGEGAALPTPATVATCPDGYIENATGCQKEPFTWGG